MSNAPNSPASEYDDLDPDEEGEGGAPERAFRNSESPKFNGLTLAPFSFARQTAAVSLGLRYGRLTEEEIERHPNPLAVERRTMEGERDKARSLAERAKKAGTKARALEEVERLEKAIAALADEPEEVTVYDGLAMDAAIVIWLCCQTESAVRRARRKPREYEADIDRWAEKQGITIQSPKLKEATQAFAEIMAQISESKGEPKPGEDHKPGTPAPN